MEDRRWIRRSLPSIFYRLPSTSAAGSTHAFREGDGNVRDDGRRRIEDGYGVLYRPSSTVYHRRRRREALMPLEKVTGMYATMEDGGWKMDTAFSTVHLLPSTIGIDGGERSCL